MARFGSGGLRIAHSRDEGPSRALALSWPELDALLPDRGLPQGVVELSTARALGGATTVAFAAVRAGQSRGEHAWCGWIDPEATLHAPGLVAAGVDLARLLVVRSPRVLLGRVAVKMVASGAFEVVVVDMDVIPGAAVASVKSRNDKGHRPKPSRWAPEVLVRKLALACEPNGATVLLLTNASKPRAMTWPVALRLELSRPNADELAIRIAKDKRGRVGTAKTIPFHHVLRVAG